MTPRGCGMDRSTPEVGVALESTNVSNPFRKVLGKSKTSGRPRSCRRRPREVTPSAVQRKFTFSPLGLRQECAHRNRSRRPSENDRHCTYTDGLSCQSLGPNLEGCGRKEVFFPPRGEEGGRESGGRRTEET